jgi:hypothetical protein
MVWPFMPSRLRTGRRSTCDPGRKARPGDVHRQTALDAVNYECLNRPLLVVCRLDLIPCPQALRLLVREIDVTLFGLAFLAHHIDFVARLEARLAFVIQHFSERQHAL